MTNVGVSNHSMETFCRRLELVLLSVRLGRSQMPLPATRVGSKQATIAWRNPPTWWTSWKCRQMTALLLYQHYMSSIKMCLRFDTLQLSLAVR